RDDLLKLNEFPQTHAVHQDVDGTRGTAGKQCKTPAVLRIVDGLSVADREHVIRCPGFSGVERNETLDTEVFVDAAVGKQLRNLERVRPTGVAVVDPDRRKDDRERGGRRHAPGDWKLIQRLGVLLVTSVVWVKQV